MNSFWTVLVIAVLIAVYALYMGGFTLARILALIALLIIGALWPPAGIVIGGVALLWLTLRNGPSILQKAGLINKGQSS